MNIAKNCGLFKKSPKTTSICQTNLDLPVVTIASWQGPFCLVFYCLFHPGSVGRILG